MAYLGRHERITGPLPSARILSRWSSPKARRGRKTSPRSHGIPSTNSNSNVNCGPPWRSHEQRSRLHSRVHRHSRRPPAYHMAANWSPMAQEDRQSCFGIWAVGTTGTWPQVCNIWEEPDSTAGDCRPARTGRGCRIISSNDGGRSAEFRAGLIALPAPWSPRSRIP